jgi:hypothetical protein
MAGSVAGVNSQANDWTPFESLTMFAYFRVAELEAKLYGITYNL